MTKLAVFLATSGGAGYAPVAPGTAGSAVGVLVFLLVRDWPLLWLVGLIFAVTAAGTWASGRAASHFGGKDPRPVVIDEIAGQLVTLAGSGGGAGAAVAGFLLFRLLDIVKPWPARQLETLPGGIGIMADDLMAGAYGNILLFVVLRLAPWLS